MKLSMHFIVLMALWLVSALFVLLQSSFSSWFLLSSVSVLLFYILIVPAAAMSKVNARREVVHSPYAGGEANVRMVLECSSWLPLPWLGVRDVWQDAPVGVKEQGSVTVERLCFPWFRSSVEFRYTFPLLRGTYENSGPILTTGDFFGFVQRRKRIPRENRFLVYPTPIRQVRNLPGELGGPLLSWERVLTDPQTEPSTAVRDYIQGDSMKNIHWKATARTLQMKTRETERTETERMSVCLDASAGRTARKASDAFEYCVQLAAGLCEYAAERKMSLELHINNRQTSGVILDRHSGAEDGFEQLAKVRRDGKLGFDEFIRQKASGMMKGPTILLTSSLSDKLVRALSQLRRAGNSVYLIYVNESPVLSLHDRRWLSKLDQMDMKVNVLSASVLRRDGWSGGEHDGFTA